MAERPGVSVRRARSPEDWSQVRALFLEYAGSLEFDLAFQDFEHELASLAEHYGEPGGCVLLALSDAATIGCVAVRPFASGICEMKRLYVRPSHRGLGAGRLLVDAVIQEGRARGYRKMRLDTVPGMDAAIALYRALGFRGIQPYRANPVAGALYMECDL